VLGKEAKERIVPVGKYVRTTPLHYIEKARPVFHDTDCNHLFLTCSARVVTATRTDQESVYGEDTIR